MPPSLCGLGSGGPVPALGGVSAGSDRSWSWARQAHPVLPSTFVRVHIFPRERRAQGRVGGRPGRAWPAGGGWDSRHARPSPAHVAMSLVSCTSQSRGLGQCRTRKGRHRLGTGGDRNPTSVHPRGRACEQDRPLPTGAHDPRARGRCQEK